MTDIASHLLPRRAWRSDPGLVSGVEGSLLLLGLGALLLVALLSTALDQTVAWGDLWQTLRSGLLLVCLGVLLRWRGLLAGTATALVTVGLYKTVAPLVMVLSYFRFTGDVGSIDTALLRIDAALGYSWVATVEAVAAWPAFGRALGVIYMSSMVQLLLVVGVLAALGRRADLHRFTLTSLASLAATVAVWALLPSFGPATLHAVAPEVAARIGLVVNEAYVAELHRLAAEGNAVISSLEIVGAVAFPSFHIIMACLATWFSRRTWLFWPAVAVNLLMVPATLVHGGHHLVDLLGGVAVFAACLWLAGRLVPEEGAPRRPLASHRPSDAR